MQIEFVGQVVRVSSVDIEILVGVRTVHVCATASICKQRRRVCVCLCEHRAEKKTDSKARFSLSEPRNLQRRRC